MRSPRGDREVMGLNPRRYLLLALASALLASGLAFDVLVWADKTASVVVAADAVSRFQRIGDGDVKVVNLPVRAIHPQAATRRDEVVGKIALSEMVPGEQVLRAKLSADEKDGNFLSRLAPNQRAFLVPLNLTRAAGGAVRVGDMVDLILVASEQETGASFSRTIAHGLEVLDVRDERGQRAEEGADEALPIGLIVAATSAQAELLALASENGQLYVAIDGYDAAPGMTTGASPADLAGP